MITILKTVTAKELCNHLQLPVILVQSMGDDTNDKLIKYLSTAIDFDCIFFFDEYEKEFKDSSDVLSFMDGTYNSIYRKIFLLTTNKLNVDSNLLGRPSRIRYKKSFGNLSEEEEASMWKFIASGKYTVDGADHQINVLMKENSVISADAIAELSEAELRKSYKLTETALKDLGRKDLINKYKTTSEVKSFRVEKLK